MRSVVYWRWQWGVVSVSQVCLELAPVHAVGCMVQAFEHLMMVISGPGLRMVEWLLDVSVSIVVMLRRHGIHWMGPLVVVMMVGIHQLI